MRENVQCKHTTVDLNVAADHVEGGQLRFVVYAGDAMVDASGCIRFFAVRWEDIGEQYYKLVPYRTKPEEVGLAIADFLASFGLTRLGGRLVRGNKMPVNLSRHLFFSNPGGTLIRSFAAKHVLPEHLGYVNILNDKLIFTKPIYVR
jgi:hypothetical protein